MTVPSGKFPPSNYFETHLLPLKTSTASTSMQFNFNEIANLLAEYTPWASQAVLIGFFASLFLNHAKYSGTLQFLVYAVGQKCPRPICLLVCEASPNT